MKYLVHIIIRMNGNLCVCLSFQINLKWTSKIVELHYSHSILLPIFLRRIYQYPTQKGRWLLWNDKFKPDSVIRKRVSGKDYRPYIFVHIFFIYYPSLDFPWCLYFPWKKKKISMESHGFPWNLFHGSWKIKFKK